MIKFTFPVDTGNDAIRSGTVEKIFKQIAQELKPEAAYFFPQGGERGGLIVVDMTASSQVVEVAERFFFGLNAKVEMMPVMALEDLQKGLSSVEGIVQTLWVKHWRRFTVPHCRAALFLWPRALGCDWNLIKRSRRGGAGDRRPAAIAT